MKFGKRVNLHTHTARCGHASGEVVEYCQEAIKQGIAVLGFSDHAPFPDDRFGDSRMDFSELPDYVRDISCMRDLFPDLTILTGVEVDFVPSLGKAFYEDTYSHEKGFDYRILGPHFIDPLPRDTPPLSIEYAKAYTELTIKGMQSGLFDYVAHPDMFTARYPSWTPELRKFAIELAEASKTLDIPFEINAYGLRKSWINSPEGDRPQYPWSCFWEVMAEYGVRMVVGSDAHRPCDVWGNTDDAIAFGAIFALAPENANVSNKIIQHLRLD
ncbi:MAG: histidinol-phosphatase [Victivallales bacterium]|jgi:histidinol-phosphatase (PHP family)|nr:histidinol-phosphatase [Victivallales bacterium]